MPSITPRHNDEPVTHRSTWLARGATTFLLAAIVAGCTSTSARKSATTEPAVTASGHTGATPTSGTKRGASLDSYLEPTDASVGATLDFLGDGPFVMLNLFRLRKVPDFTAHPELKPKTPMSSRDLFYRYIAHMDGFLDRVGAKRILLADSGPMLIGPSSEHWDVVQMVEYPSTQAFIELGLQVKDEVAEREVMLSDSRIMPMQKVPLDAVVNVG